MSHIISYCPIHLSKHKCKVFEETSWYGEKFIVYSCKKFNVGQLIFPERGKDQKWVSNKDNPKLDTIEINGNAYPIISE